MLCSRYWGVFSRRAALSTGRAGQVQMNNKITATKRSSVGGTRQRLQLFSGTVFNDHMRYSNPNIIKHALIHMHDFKIVRLTYLYLYIAIYIIYTYFIELRICKIPFYLELLKIKWLYIYLFFPIFIMKERKLIQSTWYCVYSRLYKYKKLELRVVVLDINANWNETSNSKLQQ